MAVSFGQEELEQVGSGHMTGPDLQGWKGPLWLPGERMGEKERRGAESHGTQAALREQLDGKPWLPTG